MADAIEIPRNEGDLYRRFGAPVYPAHPLVLLVYTLTVYMDPETALQPMPRDDSPWPRMVGDARIPGDGGGAAVAARLLKRLLDGEPSHAIVDEADAYFRSLIEGQGESFADRLEPGIEQAAAMRSVFEMLVTLRIVDRATIHASE